MLNQIENKTIGIFKCTDDNMDEIRIVESICFNTKVLNIKSINKLLDKKIITEVILDKEKAVELCKCLINWANDNWNN
ncbi:hypothetical protein FDG09_17200 [Clostridium sporogenes]|uniref:hypothetical protein n=1 Tax=Clostridium sporogenes TaxID=1509 RepID=UPI0013D6EA5E|nr:hypothetical protein [Clostridium sporogenes]NFV14561.1 hypothetical protein [Clostridium sporogenes]